VGAAAGSPLAARIAQLLSKHRGDGLAVGCWCTRLLSASFKRDLKHEVKELHRAALAGEPTTKKS
jgi:hypothetical protein